MIVTCSCIKRMLQNKMSIDNSYERIFSKWIIEMIPLYKDINDKRIIGLKYNKYNNDYEFIMYKNENDLRKNSAFLPEDLILD